MGELFRRLQTGTPLAWTGERMVPGQTGAIEAEHFHRYFLARELCRGMDVLDVASGEGYGSAFLAQTARRVIGVEVDPATVEHAAREYQSANLQFVHGDATNLPIEDYSVDVVVSFETIEHIADHRRFLAEVKRVLRPNGFLLISTPDINVYSAPGTESNPFHVRELTEAEFRATLSGSFRNVELLRQRAMGGSAILPNTISPGTNSLSIFEQRDSLTYEAAAGLLRAPYLLAVASDYELPDVGVSLFIQKDYEAELRAAAEKTHQEWSQRIEAEQQYAKSVAELEQQIQRQNDFIRQQEEDIRKKSQRMSELDRELIHRDAAATERELQTERQNDVIRQQKQVIQLKEQLVHERDETLKLTNESLRKAEQRTAELDEELADLTRIRATLNQELQEARDESQRLRSVLDNVLTSRSWRYTAALRRLKKWLASLGVARLDPRRYRQHLKFWRDVRLLSRSTLFDAAWYLANNPDVAQAGVDPITHYLQYGAHEGRDPSESFNTSRYLENNPDVRQAGVNPLVHYLLRGAAEGRFAPAARRAHTTVVAAEPYDVFAYISTSMDPSALPKRVAIGVSSLGNFFMAEIAYMMENAFRNLGATTRLFAEHEASNVADYETVVVVAPHEFFLLGQGPAALQALKGSPALIMFNVEQGQTQWFRVAEQYLPYASAVLDISYHTARRLARSGYKSFFLPLGYSDYLERSFDGRELPEHEIFKYMPAPLRSYLPTTYAERPIDILFIGASSPRRKNFFSQHGSYFADKASFIYLPDTTRPFLTTESRTINFATFVALLKRSKILLNVHQDDEPFFEWQRIVNLGIMQRTLVISDHCEPVPCIEPNIDYLDGPLAALPALCEFALNDLQEAERIADHAYTKLKTQYPMEQILAKCWTALARTLC